MQQQKSIRFSAFWFDWSLYFDVEKNKRCLRWKASAQQNSNSTMDTIYYYCGKYNLVCVCVWYFFIAGTFGTYNAYENEAKPCAFFCFKLSSTFLQCLQWNAHENIWKWWEKQELWTANFTKMWNVCIRCFFLLAAAFFVNLFFIYLFCSNFCPHSWIRSWIFPNVRFQFNNVATQACMVYERYSTSTLSSICSFVRCSREQ